MDKLELRLYGLVPYNISPIQQGIQYGHSKDEYALYMFEMLEKGLDSFDSESLLVYKNFKDWLKNWKTYIVLNGGTTNNNPDRLGSLNKHLQTLKDNQVFCSEFYEIDLGDQLTGVDFIVDERVFGKNEDGSYKWLEFEDWIWDNTTDYLLFENIKPRQLKLFCQKSENNDLRQLYDNWVLYMGGDKNVFLRSFLKQFRLA
jgi:hypothetical protein